MATPPDNQDKERIANSARYLVESLSAAISAGNITKAAGLIKQLEGIPPELLPPGVSLPSIAADFESAKSNSNSGPDAESTAATRAREEEERKAAERATMVAIESSTRAVHDFLNRDDIKESTALNQRLAEKVKRGESLSEADGRDFTERHAKERDEEIKLARKLLEHPTEEELKAKEEEKRRLISIHGPAHKEVEDHDAKWSRIFTERATEGERVVKRFGDKVTALNQASVQTECEKRGIDHRADTQEYKDMVAEFNLSRSRDNKKIETINTDLQKINNATAKSLGAKDKKIVNSLLAAAHTPESHPTPSITPKRINPKKLAR